MKSYTLMSEIEAFVAQHGTLRAAARVLKIDHGYLSRLMRGEKVAPSDALLRKLGLRKVVMYERIK